MNGRQVFKDTLAKAQIITRLNRLQDRNAGDCKSGV
jgi:putative component of toxin-antitoxin plasmid stabilization module